MTTPRSPERTRGSPHDDRDLGEPPAKKQKESDQSQATATGKRRQAACQACRIRKVKCDKKRPCCALCQTGGIACEYVGDSDEKITLETATSTILERLDLLRQDLDGLKHPRYQGNIYSDHAPLPTNGHAIPINTDPLDALSLEPSRDFLRIPPHRASADTILQWEIFQNKYPPNALIGTLFTHDQNDPYCPSPDILTPPMGLLPLDEEQIPTLIDRFLTNVYTKNPILDVEALVKHGRKCADHGVGWDGSSCLVLMACALGAVAKPFDRYRRATDVVSPGSDNATRTANSSARVFANELQQGDSCFALACRRLGSLKYSMLGAQCYFFAGVYLMYTLRPLQSWHYFTQASTFCQFYLRMTHGLSDTFAEALSSPPQALSPADRKTRRLEQCLYWSCFKSECEFRVELPLPQSEISLGEYPTLFPSPPSPAPGLSTTTQQPPDQNNTTTISSSPFPSPVVNVESIHLRHHAQRLCNEEESWYYYLTEIALRRIGNRIINTFFPQPRPSWWLTSIRPLLRMAREFEAQVSSWSAHLPPAMQQYETSSMIRAPHLDDGEGGYVSRELSWAVDNRLLEMQTWLYQPFLYYLVHCGLPRSPSGYADSAPLDPRQASINNLLNPWSPGTNASSTHSLDYMSHQASQLPISATGLDSEGLAVLESLIRSGIECSLKTIDVRARGHRHHGLWFDLRSIMSASLVLLAIIKSGKVAWIPGGTEAVWGTDSFAPTPGGTRPIRGRLGKVIAQFEFWADESPDMRRYIAVLEGIVRDARGF